MTHNATKRGRKEVEVSSRKRVKASPKDAGRSLARDPGTVTLETLPWNEVAFPENFQDAEGFFGLEEISDVEVLRDIGRVEYRLSTKTPQNRTQTATEKAPNTAGDENVRQDKAKHTLEDEWEGFEEPEVVAQRNDVRDKAPKPSKEAIGRPGLKAAKSDGPKGKRDVSVKNADKSVGNTFEVLGEDGDEDDGEVEEDVSAWDYLNLSSETMSSLAKLRFSHPTPIQSAALPHILKGEDAICKAPTGSGKTLAFGIPIYEHFLEIRNAQDLSNTKSEKKKNHHPISLIISPTRELAHQLSSHLKDLSSDVNSPSPAIATVTGGLSMHKQQRLIATADVIIGTPGRLWEVISGNPELVESLRKIKHLILDEADRLLGSGHFQEVEEILHALDRSKPDEAAEDEGQSGLGQNQHRQTLVFSATFEKDLHQKLAGKSKSSGNDPSKRQSMEYLLKRLNFKEEKPRFIDVNPMSHSQMAKNLKEGIVECAGTEKDLYLYSLLLHYPQTRILVFTNSITSVRRLTPFLQNLALPAYALHSQMPQKARLRSLERFSSPSTSSILIATDVAARGLDIPSVQLVVHYHLPRAADMYVHRSGRTARADKSGSSILLCAPEEIQGVRRLIAKVHARNSSKGPEDGKKFFMRTIDLDRRVVARVKPRVALSKKISDAALANERKGHEDNWLKTAAEDLGVDYDSEEFAAGEGSKKGRGQGRKKREKEARDLTKGDVGALRAELRQLLAQRVNVGVSERYLTAGGVDLDELLNGEKRGEFLGKVDGGLDDL